MTRMTRTLWAGAILIAMCGLVLAQDAEPKTEASPDAIDLTPVFKKDKSARYRQTETTELKMEIMGEKQHTVSTKTYDTTQTCIEVLEDGGAKIKLKYDRVALKEVENKKTTLNYDSSKDKLEDLEPGERMKAVVVGLEFTLTVNAAGEVQKLEGYEEFEKAVREKVGEMYAAMVKGIVGETLMRDSVEQAYRNLPKEKVKKGDKWTAEWSMKAPMLGEMAYKMENTLEGKASKSTRKCAKVAQTGDMTISGGMVESKNADWKGTAWIDLETREIVLSESTIKCDMTMDMGQKMEFPAEITLRMELLPEKKGAADDTSNAKDGGK